MIARDSGAEFELSRLAEGMTQHEVADRLGITRQAVQQMEQGGVRAIWRMQVNQQLRNKRRQHGR